MRKKRNTKSVKSKIIDILINTVCIAGASACIFLFVQNLNESMSKDEEPIAVVYHKRNTAQRRFADTNLWQKVNKEDPVYAGDRIRTGDQSEAYIVFNNESVIELDENTLVQVFDDKGKKSVDFLNGSISVTSSEQKTDAAESIVVTTGTKKINLKNNSNAIISGKKDTKETVVAVTSGVVEVEDKEPEKEPTILAPVLAPVTKKLKPASETKNVSRTVPAGVVAVVEQPKSVTELKTVSIDAAETNKSTAPVVKRIKTQKPRTPEQQKEMVEAAKSVFGETKGEEISQGVQRTEVRVQEKTAPEIQKIIEEEKALEEQKTKEAEEAAKKAEAEKKAKALAEQKAKEDAIKKAEAARKAEEERQAKALAEQKAKAEAAKKAEEERQAKALAEQKAKAEAARKAEEERQAKALAEQKAKAEAARKAEEERQAKALAEQKAKEEAEKKAEEEKQKNLALIKQQKEEATKQAQEAVAKKAEENRLARLEAERRANVATSTDKNETSGIAAVPNVPSASSAPVANVASPTANVPQSDVAKNAAPKTEAAKKEPEKTDEATAKKSSDNSNVKITKLKPVLKSPANNFMVTEDILIEEDAIVFRWGKMKDAAKYKITIRENSSSGKKVFEKTVKSNSFKLRDDDLACLDNGTYVWSVVGMQVEGGKTYSSHAASQSFSVHIDDIGTATIDKSTLLH